MIGLGKLSLPVRFCFSALSSARCRPILNQFLIKMNKAFIREPDDDGRAYCPRCKTLGRPVDFGPLDTHIRPEFRAKMQDSAWFCAFPRCDVAYFNLFGGI